jgi:ATP:ADP antiporter, AAA family
MASSQFWLRILNVYPNESKMVKRLYLFQFFQGAGLAFFFTSAFAQFLGRFPITELPWVLVCASALLWVTGLIYTQLEHRMKFVRFNVVNIVAMSCSMLLLWVANYTTAQGWFLYLMLAWFNVLYLLNNLQFWGIASQLFDLRQSKRLFAVISSGDIPAKFIGYTLALLLVPITGTQNLLLLAAACTLASLPFFQAIAKSGELDAHAKPHEHKSIHPPKGIRKIVKNIVGNLYIRRIAFISLLCSTCIILINYGFYGEVKKAYHDDVAMARFIALFYASLRIIAFITKMVFTSRLTARLGIKQALFITPLGMVVMIALIVGISWLSPNEKLIFYLFGTASILTDVLRTSFNSPVLLTLMQPLPTHERLRAHNIVKGIMDPFASFLSGVFLLTLFYLHDRVDLMFISYVLLVLGVLWIGGVFLVNRQYLSILIKTIGNRYFSREEFNLNDPKIIEQLSTKMMTVSDLEAISILRMLNSKLDPLSEELITRLLQHPSEAIKLESLRLIKTNNINNIREKLEEFLQKNDNPEVRNQAVKTYCRIAEVHWGLSHYLNHPWDEIRKASIIGMLSNNDQAIRQNAENELQKLLVPGNKTDKMVAISILHELRDQYDHPAHYQSIIDSDQDISAAAMKAIGRACLRETLDALVTHIYHSQKIVLSSLHQAGERSVPLLKKQIMSINIDKELAEKLISLCGKIGGDAAKQVLVDLLKVRPQYTTDLIKALYRCHYTADEKTQKLLEAIARQYIIYGVEVMYMQQMLTKKAAEYSVLNSSLHHEIQEIRELLLCLFSCMYDRDKINKVKYGLNASHKEAVANAMEIIELTVKKDIGKSFNTMFENTTIQQRCTALRSLFTEKEFSNVEHILSRILSEKPILYYNWTKACSLYISRKYLHPVDSALYKKYITSDNKLLKETALFAAVPS